MASPGSRAGVAATLVAGLVLGGCGSLPGAQGNPNDPILVRGRVVDAKGAAASGANLEVDVLDRAHGQVGQAIPKVFSQTFTAGLDGSFEIHLRPTPELVAFAHANGDYLNVSVITLAADGSFVAPFGFSRQIVLGTWAGAPASFVVGPTGIQQPANLVPVPLPAQT